MSEVYRDATGKSVTLDVSGATVSSVKFKRNGAYVGTTSNVSPVPLPYLITHEDGPFQVEWTYTLESNTYTRLDDHEVVTPVFVESELFDYDSNFNTLSSAQVVRLERFIRLIIQAYTGQHFGYSTGTIDAYGDGSSVLSLSKRIVAVDTPLGNYRITPTGYGIELLRGYPSGSGTYDPKTDVVYSPYTFGTSSFRNNVKYTVTGKFGWASVPSAVKEAALILAGEFSCNEATWRDRYIKSIRAADWRFDFHGSAFTGTGSVSADLLLDQYRVVGAAVI